MQCQFHQRHVIKIDLQPSQHPLMQISMFHCILHVVVESSAGHTMSNPPGFVRDWFARYGFSQSAPIRKYGNNGTNMYRAKALQHPQPLPKTQPHHEAVQMKPLLLVYKAHALHWKVQS